jgi:hypothetical protein
MVALISCSRRAWGGAVRFRANGGAASATRGGR